MRKRRTLLCTAFLLSLLTLLSACSGTGGKTVDKNATKDFVNLTWYMKKPTNDMSHQESVEAAANKIIKEKINANLHFAFIDAGSWDQKTNVMLASGEEYDIMFCDQAKLVTAVQKGAYVALDELLSKYGADIKKQQDDRAWKAATFSGKIMAVPAERAWSLPQSIVFKKDLVTKYNFDYTKVKTLKDVEPYLKEIKEKEPGITPLMVTGKSSAPGIVPANIVGLGNGISIDEKTGKIDQTINFSENTDYYKTMYDYYQKGYIAKDAATQTDYMSQAKSGKYAVMSDGGNGYTKDGSKSSALFGYPCVEAFYTYPYVTTSVVLGSSAAISNTSKNPERAMMLLNLIWQDKTLLNTLAYGVEGQDYTVKSGAGTENPSVVPNSGSEQKWAVWHNWLGPLWNQWDSTWNTTDSLKQMQDNNKNAKTSQALGFVMNIDSVKNEAAQISAVGNEVSPVLTTGVEPNFDQYMSQVREKYKNAGIEKMLAETKTQYDAWKKSNSK